MAKLSPSRISTVVEVSRRLKAFTVKPFEVKPLAGSMEDTAAISSRLMMSPSTTAGTKVSSTPKGLYSTEIWPPSCATGIGIFAAGQELRLLPRQGGQVRFGQRAHDAAGFQRFEQDADLQPAGIEAEEEGAVVGVAWRAIDPLKVLPMAPDVTRLPVPPVVPRLPFSAVPCAATRGGQRLADAALHFRKADLQHDLLGAADAHQVGHPLRRVALRQFQRAVQTGGAADRAGQHDAVIGGAHLDLFAGQDLLQPFLELGDVGRDLHLDVGDQRPSAPRSVIVVRPGALPSSRSSGPTGSRCRRCRDWRSRVR